MSSICLAFRLGWLLGLENRLTPSCWTSNDCVGYDVPNPATPGKPLPIIWILGRALTPRLKCQHTRLRPDSIQPSDFRRLLARAHILQTPLATSHVSLRGRSHQSPKAVHNRSTRGDFSTTSSFVGVYCVGFGAVRDETRGGSQPLHPHRLLTRRGSLGNSPGLDQRFPATTTMEAFSSVLLKTMNPSFKIHPLFCQNFSNLFWRTNRAKSRQKNGRKSHLDSSPFSTSHFC